LILDLDYTANVSALQSQVSTLQSTVNDHGQKLARLCATGRVVNYAWLSSLYNAYYLNLNYAYC